jgi:hypothetical protein
MLLSIDDPDGILKGYSARRARCEFVNENSLTTCSNEDDGCHENVTLASGDEGLAIEREESNNVQICSAKAV